MTTKHITTLHDQDVCDLCGRTLLRGERSEAFLDGHRRYSVCELCKPHALHEGWVREGTIPDYHGAAGGANRRRSLLGRLRGRGSAGGGFAFGRAGRGFEDDFGEEFDEDFDDEFDAGSNGRRGRGGGGRGRDDEGPVGEHEPMPLPEDEMSVGGWPPPEPVSAPVRDLEPDPAPAPRSGRRGRGRGTRDEPRREPRRVHAVPTGEQQKFAAALDAFNRTEYTRTVASVSRSLGVPAINLVSDPAHPTLVRVVASWELCWYRYEVDLSDDPGRVRLDGQGYELGELAEHELVPNAVADDAGRLHVE